MHIYSPREAVAKAKAKARTARGSMPTYSVSEEVAEAGAARDSVLTCSASEAVAQVAAARQPAVSKRSFLAGARRDLGAALAKCQGSVHRIWVNLMAKATGRRRCKEMNSQAD